MSNNVSAAGLITRAGPIIHFFSVAVVLACSSEILFAQNQPHLVKLVPIQQREIRDAQTFVGTVMPSRRASIGSAVDGRVVEFPINEGDRVASGQTLAQLLTETISLELEAAVAELELRQQELDELKNGSRPEEIEQARARMEAARAATVYLESQEKRMLDLYAKGRAASDQQVAEARSQALEARESFAEATAAHQLSIQGPRPERIAQAAARVATQNAIVKRLRDQIRKHTIIARFDGFVVAEHSEVGQWVTRGDLVAEVMALDEVDVEAQVVESQVPYVRIGSSVNVNIPALPGQSFSGSVISVVPNADVRTRTFPVRIRITNVMDDQGQPLLKSGMLAQVILPTGPTVQALLVPKDSLVLGGERTLVWVVDTSKATQQPGSSFMTAIAQPVPVERGIEHEGLIQVAGDLSEDESVVVLGNERIPPPRPGQTTMVRWVPMTTTAGGPDGTP